MESGLTAQAKFSLFVSSYSPLFILIIIRQFFNNLNCLCWGGISLDSVVCLLRCYGLIMILIPLIIFGFKGLKRLMPALIERTKSGKDVVVLDVKNKSSEALSYIGTYIIPFVYNDFISFADSISLLILLTLIYSIYTSSSLIVINPILNWKYPIYEATLKFHDMDRTCLIITQCRYLDEGDSIRVKAIGHKLFFGVKNEVS